MLSSFFFSKLLCPTKSFHVPEWFDCKDKEHPQLRHFLKEQKVPCKYGSWAQIMWKFQSKCCEPQGGWIPKFSPSKGTSRAPAAHIAALRPGYPHYWRFFVPARWRPGSNKCRSSIYWVWLSSSSELCPGLPHAALPALPRSRHFAVQRCEGRALSPHGLQLSLSGSRAAMHPRARQGTFLWQFSCFYACWGCSGVHAHPAQVPQQDPPCTWGVGKRTWSPQGKHGAQSYCSCMWHPWKGKTHRKRRRNRIKDIK